MLILKQKLVCINSTENHTIQVAKLIIPFGATSIGHFWQCPIQVLSQILMSKPGH